MTNLTRLTNLSVEMERVFDAAKAQAIEEFANAKTEEIMLAAANLRLAVVEARRRLVLTTFNVTDVAKLGEKLSKNKYAAWRMAALFAPGFVTSTTSVVRSVLMAASAI